MTVVAIMSLSLGIGANSTVFSIVDGVFLRQLPVREPHRLVKVFTASEQDTESESSYADYLDLRSQNSVFTALAAYADKGAVLSVNGQSELVPVEVVSEDFFSVLGVKAANGNVVYPVAHQGPEQDCPVVISNRLWHRRLAGDRSVPGKAITLNGKPAVIVGVTPPEFHGMERYLFTDVWIPTSSWEILTPSAKWDLSARASREYWIVGRLKDGVGIVEVRSQLGTLGARLAAAYPTTNKRIRFTAASEEERARRSAVPSLFLLTITGLVLLICCSNVANLLLAHGQARSAEIAIRMAVGASRSRVIFQLVSESTLLALIGAAAGLALTYAMTRMFPLLVPPISMPMGFDIRLDNRVVGFTLLVSLVTPLLFALVPAFRTSRVRLVSELRGETASAGRGLSALLLRHSLVVGEVALAVILLTVASLVIRSLMFSQRIYPGFDTSKNMLLVSLAPEVAGFNEGQTTRFYTSLAARMRALPGVAAASFAKRVPLSLFEGGAAQKVQIPGHQPLSGAEGVDIRYNIVGMNYFGTIGTRVLEGREFNQMDGPTSPKVVVVSEAMQRRFWPGESALGKWLRVDDSNWQIIGIAEDTKNSSLHESPEPYMYFAALQRPLGGATLLVNTAGTPESMLPSLIRAAREEDLNVPVLKITTLDQHLRTALYSDRMAAGLLGCLALVGVFLATVGLYGVVSCSVSRRTHEIGIRMALGARTADILAEVIGRGLKLALLGTVIGISVAFWSTRMMASILYGISPSDSISFLTGSCLVVAVALAASYIPARQATKVTPAIALRHY